MEVVINHLTRMRGERICVAGVDWDTASHVRPVTTAGDPLTRRLLRSRGGLFEIGALVDLGEVTAVGEAPEVEDHRFSPQDAQYVRTLTPGDYLRLLDIMSSSSLEEGFGPDLERVGRWKYAVPTGKGERSLVVVRANSRCRISVDDKFERPKVSFKFANVDPPAFVPVTDLRFFYDQAVIRHEVVTDVDRRLRRGTDAFIMFGLGRPWDDDPDHHWLQVNGICLADKPLGDSP